MAHLGTRIGLAFQRNTAPAPRPSLLKLLGEGRALAEPVLRKMRKFELPVTKRPQSIMLLPGFGTHPIRMRFIERHLRGAGHHVEHWGMGFNWGPTHENIAFLEEHIDAIHQKRGEKIVLVGWSLGGLFARELAKSRPQKIAKVISMGTPFSGNPRANNVWRIYQFITGHRVDNPPVTLDFSTKPPVPTIAFWSRSDGMISVSSAKGQAGERDAERQLACNHIGFTYSPHAIRAIYEELELDA